MFCKQYIVFNISVGDTYIDYLYDTVAGRFHNNTYYGSYKFLYQPIAVTENQYVSYLDDPEIYKELVNTGFERMNPEQEKHLLEDEGGVLIFYAMR